MVDACECSVGEAQLQKHPRERHLLTDTRVCRVIRDHFGLLGEIHFSDQVVDFSSMHTTASQALLTHPS